MELKEIDERLQSIQRIFFDEMTLIKTPIKTETDHPNIEYKTKEEYEDALKRRREEYFVFNQYRESEEDPTLFEKYPKDIDKYIRDVRNSKYDIDYETYRESALEQKKTESFQKLQNLKDLYQER